MALPSSKNTDYGPAPRTVLAADLNDIQDSIFALYNGESGSRYRFLGMHSWIPDQGASPTASGDNLIWTLNASGEEVYRRLVLKGQDRIVSVGFVCNPLSSTGLIVGFHRDSYTSGATVSNTTQASSATGWQTLSIAPSITLASGEMPYLSVKFNAGSGGQFFGALVEFDHP